MGSQNKKKFVVGVCMAILVFQTQTNLGFGDDGDSLEQTLRGSMVTTSKILFKMNLDQCEGIAKLKIIKPISRRKELLKCTAYMRDLLNILRQLQPTEEEILFIQVGEESLKKVEDKIPGGAP